MQTRLETQFLMRRPVTIPDTDTTTDTCFAVAEQSVDVLRKRHGAEMRVAGAVPSDLVRNDLETGYMNVEVNLDATQMSGPPRKNGQNHDVTKGYDELVCGRCRK